MKIKDLINILITTQLKASGVSVFNENIDTYTEFTYTINGVTHTAYKKTTVSAPNVNEARIINWINLAIADINKRFNLYQNAVYVKRNKDNKDGKIILPHDYMNILACIDDKYKRVPINKENDKHSIYTPNPKTIIIPDYWIDRNLTIVYLQSIEWITDKEKDLPIPDHFIRAIMHFVSYLAFETIEGAEGYQHHSHLKDYENELNTLDMLGYKPNESLINLRKG